MNEELQEVSQSNEPVRRIPTDPPVDQLRPGIGLCLSGGGYRAMLFHLGALWRLNDFGYLPKLERISSVSGGSITAGVLGANWSSFSFDAAGVALNFGELVAKPTRKLAGKTIDVWAFLAGVLGPGNVAEWVTKSYRRHLFGSKTLQDLPDRPRFVINATNVQSGVLWRFSKPYMWDYRVGQIKNPRLDLAVAVAASSAFPPVLSPLTLRFDPDEFTANTGTDLQHEPFTKKVILTDGGVYDNLGLETVWKQLDTILVSDAGGKMSAAANPKRNWISHSVRVLGVIDNQVRSLRKRQVIDAFKKANERKGTYWGIRTDIRNYGLSDVLVCPFHKTLRLADLPTGLKRINEVDQEKLINWGYAVCDAAMRRHVDKTLMRSMDFPYAASGV